MRPVAKCDFQMSLFISSLLASSLFSFLPPLLFSLPVVPSSVFLLLLLMLLIVYPSGNQSAAVVVVVVVVVVVLAVVLFIALITQ